MIRNLKKINFLVETVRYFMSWSLQKRTFKEEIIFSIRIEMIGA